VSVRAVVVVVCGALCACGSLPGERPAVIAAPSIGARAELAPVVALASEGVAVTLADDAFARDSVLTVERRAPPGPQGRAATGRTLDEPTRLRLVLDGSRCELVREADGRRFPLHDVHCVALDAPR
jgi:hypothetical protein